MKNNPQTNESTLMKIVAYARRWSLIIIVLGFSAVRSGSESGISFLTWVGVVIALTGALLWVYKFQENLGLIVAIAGASLAMLGNPVSNSTLFGKTLEAADKAPYLITGLILIALGMGGWAYLRSARKQRTTTSA